MTVDLSGQATDAAMMARCVELSRIAVAKGEYPFATVIARDGEVVAEAINRSVREGDVSRHAEVIALSQAQKALGREPLRRHTLYTNIEPCAMCSYCIREAWLGRVVYALESPVMGGLTKWNILRDSGIADRMPQVFGPAPEVTSGVLVKETQQVWHDWNPLAWEMIKLRGFLTEPPAHGVQIQVRPAHSHSLWHHLQLLFMRRGRSAMALPAGSMADHSHL
jgi:tRNA(adenine34) deaminase